jgi:hypothetical protein
LRTPGDVLSDVASIIATRGESHGNWDENMTCIARLWSAYLGQPVEAHNVGVMLALVKVGRMAGGTFNRDDYEDMVGYAAIAAAIAHKVD